MTASWTASQSGDEPVGLHASTPNAKGFASGWAELDRLLGAAPALKGAGDLGRRERSRWPRPT